MMMLTKIEVATSFKIRQVTASDIEGIDHITELHMELLGFGPMARFGDRFIRETIYASALKDNLMEIAVAEVDGHSAGFIAYTNAAHTFHRSLIRRHFLGSAWALITSLLSRPSRLVHLPRAFKVVFSRNELPDNIEDVQAEVVCFGVRPQYLTPAFVRQTNLRIGNLLLQHAFDYFRRNGFNNALMIVDADNPRPLLFYQSLGAKLTACTFGGHPSYVVLFEL